MRTVQRDTLLIGALSTVWPPQTVRPIDLVTQRLLDQQYKEGAPHSKNYTLVHSDHSTFTMDRWESLITHALAGHILWSVFALLQARLEGVQLLPELKYLLLLLGKGIRVGKSGIHLPAPTGWCWYTARHCKPKTCFRAVLSGYFRILCDHMHCVR